MKNRLLLSLVLSLFCAGPVLAGGGSTLVFEAPKDEVYKDFVDYFSNGTYRVTKKDEKKEYMKVKLGPMIDDFTMKLYFTATEDGHTTVRAKLRDIFLPRRDETLMEEGYLAAYYVKMLGVEKALAHEKAFVRRGAELHIKLEKDREHKEKLEEAKRRQELAALSPAPAAPKAPPARTYSSDVDSPAPGTPIERSDDFAVLVGIEDYQRVPKAEHGERDARTVKKHILRLGVPEENIILLTGEEATRTGISKYLEEWLPRNVSPESRVYFYYSGHGAPEPKKGDAYLLPWDGDPTFLKSTGYPLSRLFASLKALKSRENVVLLDACFSGAGGRSVIAKGTRPLVTVVPAEKPKDSRISVLSAAAGSEITGSLEEQGHGMFTYYLLKGLKGSADENRDSHVTLKELHDYTLKKVRRAARRQNREQTPVLDASLPDLRLY